MMAMMMRVMELRGKMMRIQVMIRRSIDLTDVRKGSSHRISSIRTESDSSISSWKEIGWLKVRVLRRYWCRWYCCRCQWSRSRSWKRCHDCTVRQGWDHAIVRMTGGNTWRVVSVLRWIRWRRLDDRTDRPCMMRWLRIQRRVGIDSWVMSMMRWWMMRMIMWVMMFSILTQVSRVCWRIWTRVGNGRIGCWIGCISSLCWVIVSSSDMICNPWSEAWISRGIEGRDSRTSLSWPRGQGSFKLIQTHVVICCWWWFSRWKQSKRSPTTRRVATILVFRWNITTEILLLLVSHWDF